MLNYAFLIVFRLDDRGPVVQWVKYKSGLLFMFTQFNRSLRAPTDIKSCQMVRTKRIHRKLLRKPSHLNSNFALILSYLENPALIIPSPEYKYTDQNNVEQ